jgi:hypothetical protein
MRYLVLWFGCTFFFGCISSRTVTSQLDGWNGKSKQAVVKSWGKSVESDTNSLVYVASDAGVYSSSFNYLDSGSGDMIRTHDGRCRVVFTFGSDNKVQNASWAGSLGRCYQYTLERNTKL